MCSVIFVTSKDCNNMDSMAAKGLRGGILCEIRSQSLRRAMASLDMLERAHVYPFPRHRHHPDTIRVRHIHTRVSANSLHIFRPFVCFRHGTISSNHVALPVISIFANRKISRAHISLTVGRLHSLLIYCGAHRLYQLQAGLRTGPYCALEWNRVP